MLIRGIMAAVKKSALSGALKDVGNEMSSLSRQKSSLKKSIDSASEMISQERKKELFLSLIHI